MIGSERRPSHHEGQWKATADMDHIITSQTADHTVPARR